MSLGKQLFTSYSKLIASNPETCSDIELLTKYMSYFVSGKKHVNLSVLVV